MKIDDFHPHNNEKALDRLIASAFNCSSMSNAKWVRLLDALTAPEDLVLECRAQLVWDEEPRFFAIDGITRYQFDYWQNAVESLISGPPRDWYFYKEIEWIEFPRLATQYVNPDDLKAGTHKVEQDLNAIEEAMSRTGEFDIDRNQENLRMYAYRRQA